MFIQGCGFELPPLVTINQLDTKNNLVNPFKITKYNLDTCKLETEEQTSFVLMGPEMHGAYCLTKEDFAKYKAHFQAECKTRNETKKVEDGR